MRVSRLFNFKWSALTRRFAPPSPRESVAKLGIRYLLSYEMSCRRAIFPSLHHRKEGWLRHQENFAKPPKQTRPGWFSFLFSIGKPPRPRDQWMLRDIF